MNVYLSKIVISNYNVIVRARWVMEAKSSEFSLTTKVFAWSMKAFREGICSIFGDISFLYLIIPSANLLPSTSSIGQLLSLHYIYIYRNHYNLQLFLCPLVIISNEYTYNLAGTLRVSTHG